MSNPIAIRSLLCDDHAKNIPPAVLTVIWNVTKRCNYDCGYCSPFIHDAVSPFVNLDNVSRFLDFCESHCGSDKQIQWMLTGGEPFLDPNFLTFLKLIRDKTFTKQIDVVSNGTLPLSKYQQAQDYLDGLAISLHFERSDQEINNTVDKIIALSSHKTCYTNVTVMFLPGNTERILPVVERLKFHQIPYTVKKITPIDENYKNIKPYYQSDSGRKSIELKPVELQDKDRETWNILNFENSFNNMENYYSAEESALINAMTEKPNALINAGVWFDDGSYREINTIQLVSAHQNNFKHWTCYAGVDSIYINWDGTIYRGMCTVGGPIGNINTGKDFVLVNPIKCKINQCFCTADIAVRKCSNEINQKLITKNQN